MRSSPAIARRVTHGRGRTINMSCEYPQTLCSTASILARSCHMCPPKKGQRAALQVKKKGNAQDAKPKNGPIGGPACGKDKCSTSSETYLVYHGLLKAHKNGAAYCFLRWPQFFVFFIFLWLWNLSRCLPYSASGPRLATIGAPHGSGGTEPSLNIVYTNATKPQHGHT